MRSSERTTDVFVDHLVWISRDLDADAALFRDAGLEVTGVGHHVGSPTANMLIPLADDSYVELLALDSGARRVVVGVLARTPLWPVVARRRGPAERPFLESLAKGRGLSLVVLRTTDLDDKVARLRAAGLPYGEPTEMSRETPTGTAQWRLAGAGDPDLPLLIEDTTDPGIRIPAASRRAPTLDAIHLRVSAANQVRTAFRMLTGVEQGALTIGGTRVQIGDAVTGTAPVTASVAGLSIPGLDGADA